MVDGDVLRQIHNGRADERVTLIVQFTLPKGISALNGTAPISDRRSAVTDYFRENMRQLVQWIRAQADLELNEMTEIGIVIATAMRRDWSLLIEDHSSPLFSETVTVMANEEVSLP